ncbi:hypothetical protein MTO96_041929 [Rhipicephalus appendiculatus]
MRTREGVARERGEGPVKEPSGDPRKSARPAKVSSLEAALIASPRCRSRPSRGDGTGSAGPLNGAPPDALFDQPAEAPSPYTALPQRNGARLAAEQKAGDSRSGFPPRRFPLLRRIHCCLSRWGGSVAESLRQLFVTAVQKRAAAPLLSGSPSVLTALALAQPRRRAVGVSIRPRRCYNATRTLIWA